MFNIEPPTESSAGIGRLCVFLVGTGLYGLSHSFIHINRRVPMVQGKWPKIFPVRENTGNLEILPKHRESTGNFVCSMM